MQGYDNPPQGYYQPQQQQTVVMVNQPQSQFQGQPQNIRQWTTGMCGCCEDCCGCMYCYFCHPCFMCTLASQMNECACGPFCLGCPFETSMRTKLRSQHGIKGSVLGDVCEMLWCNMCAKHQMYRELKNIGFRPELELQ